MTWTFALWGVLSNFVISRKLIRIDSRLPRLLAGRGQTEVKTLELSCDLSKVSSILQSDFRLKIRIFTDYYGIVCAVLVLLRVLQGVPRSCAVKCWVVLWWFDLAFSRINKYITCARLSQLATNWRGVSARINQSCARSWKGRVGVLIRRKKRILVCAEGIVNVTIKLPLQSAT